MTEISKLIMEIRQEAISGNKSTLPLLRKCQVLASLLKNADLKQWVARELNGYENVKDLPQYRILKAESIGNFVGAFGRTLTNAPIPLLGLGAKNAKILQRSCFFDGIGSIEGLLEADKNDRLAEVWPADFIALHASKFYEGFNLIQAYKVISRSAVAGLVEAVRNKVLEFVLELQEQIPNLERECDIDDPMKDKVQQIVNNYIYGDGNRVATCCSDVNQSVYGEMAKGNWELLESCLIELKVAREEREKLKVALEQEPPKSKSKLGGKVSAWLGRVVTQIGAGSAAGVIAKGICDYCGF